MPAPVYLVSCTAQKADRRCAARDMYVSDWFKKARAYVEYTACRWFILSAFWTVLRPDMEIDPYNLCLTYHDGNDRIRQQTWAKITAANLLHYVTPPAYLIVFAGAAYRTFLVPALRQHGFTVDTPLASLGIGQQKAWFMKRAPKQPRLPAAQEIEAAVLHHRQKIELERRVLDFKTSSKRVDIDYHNTPLFGSAQKGLFDGDL